MAAKKCRKIMDSLTIDENGQIVFDEKAKEHLEGCSWCREYYDRIQAAQDDAIPSCATMVTERIRAMEAARSDTIWIERLRRLFVFARPRILVPVVTTIAIAIILAMNFSLHLFPSREYADDYTNIVSVVNTEVLIGIGNMDKQMNSQIDELISKQARLFQLDWQDNV